jgi:DNA polymerase-3 subunit delta
MCDPDGMGVFLVTGDDETLLADVVNGLVHELVGTGDRALMVEDLGFESEAGAVVDAAQTPPFLTDSRVVIGRAIGRFTADDVKPLVAYLGDPLPTTELVLVGGGGRIAKSLNDAIKAAGGHVRTSGAPTSKRDRGQWIDEQVAAAGIRLDGPAANALANSLGEDAGRLSGILATLASTFGSGARLTEGDIAPFLGQAGSLPPWDLTDAIDGGDVRTALVVLQRMMGAGDRHPLQLMAILHTHYTRLLRMDGAGVRSEAAVGELLGLKGFQAGKVLRQYERLGSTGVQRAIELMATADVDLRGAKEWPENLVMEVLVARLARLSPAGARRR